MRKLRFRAYDTDLIEPQMIYSDDFDSLCIFFSTVSDENLMQFTGLFDKNDKPIFEGDIVTFTFEQKIISVVHWDDEFAGFEILDNGVSYCLDFNHAIEVIGNIFQHKDLLGG